MAPPLYAAVRAGVKQEQAAGQRPQVSECRIRETSLHVGLGRPDDGMQTTSVTRPFRGTVTALRSKEPCGFEDASRSESPAWCVRPPRPVRSL